VARFTQRRKQLAGIGVPTSKSADIAGNRKIEIRFSGHNIYKPIEVWPVRRADRYRIAKDV
jgi:hypothetical protein